MELNPALLRLLGNVNPVSHDLVMPLGHDLSGIAVPVSGIGRPRLGPMSAMDMGAQMAQHFASTQWMARRLGISFDGEPDNWCPIPFKFPRIPVPLPEPEPEPHPNWRAGFYLGFAARLAVIAQTAVEEDASVLNKAIDHAVGGLDRTIG